MSPHHPLPSDADASEQELAQAQAECAFALGRLDGLLVGLSADEKSLFCMMLLRETILSALVQAGFLDAQLRFDSWFSGLDRGPEETPLTSCSAHAIVGALLGDFGRHPWQPLAEAAQAITRAARFVTDRPANTTDELAGDAIAAARSLIERAGAGPESPLPFTVLSYLGEMLRAEPMFAPLDLQTRVHSIAGRNVLIEQTAPFTPLWAIDATLGRMFATGGICQPAPPFPGAVTAESLGPRLWPNERGIVAARDLAASTRRLTKLIETSRGQVGIMRERLGHLRSNARAPQVWIVLAGFSSLGLDQLGTAFGVSRRGTYAVGDALVAAGMARRDTIKGKVLLVARDPRFEARPALSDPSAPRPSAALTEFEEAMSEIERLLERNNRRG
jgi:hypothetical protein